MMKSSGLIAIISCLSLASCLGGLASADERINRPDDFKSSAPGGAEARINRTLEEFQSERRVLEKNLANFDDLDFNV